MTNETEVKPVKVGDQYWSRNYDTGENRLYRWDGIQWMLIETRDSDGLPLLRPK